MDLSWIHHSQPQFAFQASISDKPLGFPTHGKPKVLNPRRKLPLAMASVPAGLSPFVGDNCYLIWLWHFHCTNLSILGFQQNGCLNQLEIAERVELRQSNVMMKVMNMMAFNRCFLLVSRCLNPGVVLYVIFVVCIKVTYHKWANQNSRSLENPNHQMRYIT